MEKISHIVRGSSRVASTDLKSASAVRPGTPAFGRPMGESVAITEKGETTAARATAINNEIAEHKKAGQQDQIVNQMADSFFMTRIRRPDDEVAVSKGKESSEDVTLGEASEAEPTQPSGFTPRGSYVDYHA